MAMVMSPSDTIKIESSFLSNKVLVGLLFAIPFGAAVYLWKQTCDLHQRIRTLSSEDENCILSIGCQLCKRNKRFKENEKVQTLSSEENNILLFLKNALNDTNLSVEDLTDTIRCLEKQVLTVQTESNAIHKRINKLQNCQDL